MIRRLWAGGSRGLAVMALVCLALTGRAEALPQSTPAKAAILIDMRSGAVLFEKNADAPQPPASMSKLMTLDVVFEALVSGRLSLDDVFRVSRKASQMGGSKMFIREGEKVTIESLIRGVVVQSGNDAAVALAEAIAGTEARFADLLNRRARELGLDNSHFANATGWPDPEQRMSMRDLAHLAMRIITEFPEQYAYFKERSFTWDGIEQDNRNPLLDLGIGADGLKTGHTEAAGYGLVASATRGDRRVVLVLNGLDEAGQRLREGERLINWAFRAFETRRLYEAGETLVDVPVWIGDARTVPAAAARDVVVTLPFGGEAEPAITATYASPVEAPVAEGADLGHLVVSVEGMADVRIPLVATESVARGGFIARIEAAAKMLARRVLPDLFG